MAAEQTNRPVLRTLRVAIPMPKMIDKELIAACRREERKAQNELHRLCYGFLMGICLRYEKNKDDAAALLNLAFFKILTRLDQYKDNVPFEAWAKRVTINTLIDEFRKKNKDQHQFVESFDHSLPLSFMDFNEADQRFDAEDLERMIRDLPEMSQKVFNLYIVDGYNHKEIGEMLHISEGTSKWHLFTARKTLKETILQITNRVASVTL